MKISKRQFLLYGTTALVLAGVQSGCQTANYNSRKVGAVPSANVRTLERIAGQQFSQSFNISPESLPYENSSDITSTHTSLAPQKITFYYPNAENQGTIFERTLDTTGPLNAGGNDVSLLTIEQLLAQVPEDAKVAAYNLGAANKDTLSARTPSNQLSSDDGINLVQTYSNSKSNNFKICVKEISTVGRRFRNIDGYQVQIHFNQPEFKAEKRRKDIRFIADLGLDALFSSTAFFAKPYGYLTPAVAVAEDGVDGLVAYIEAKKAPTDSLLSTDTHLITNLPNAASLTSSVLDNSARTRSKEIAFVDLYDECNRLSGKGVVFTEGAYGFCLSPNCATFCIDKDRGNYLLHLLRRWSMFVPVVLEQTKTRVVESGGGRTGAPGEDSFSGEFGGGREDSSGENSFGGGRGAGSQ